MAGKKPAKRNVTNNQVKVIVLPGKIMKYVALTKDAERFKCPTCSRTFAKGLIYEEAGASYCSRRCIPKPAAVEA